MSKKRTKKASLNHYLEDKNGCPIGEPFVVKVKYVDAPLGTEIQVCVTLNGHFIGNSRRGMPWHCLVSKGLVYAARKDPNLFPHPVMEAYTIGGIVYVICHGAGRNHDFARAVRYRHNFTQTLREFDTWTRERFLEKYGDKECVITLRAPIRDKRVGAHGHRSKTPSRENGERSLRASQGAFRRAIDSGLIAKTDLGDLGLFR